MLGFLRPGIKNKMLKNQKKASYDARAVCKNFELQFQKAFRAFIQKKTLVSTEMSIHNTDTE